MHAPDCPPLNASRAALRKWALDQWPKGQPSEVDVSTLPASGAISNPLRLVDACAERPWVGVWGNFAGMRIGYSPTETFQLLTATAFAYPFGADMYLSKDTGGAGIASFGLFKTREAALAFAGARNSQIGKIPPGVNPYTPGDSQANPTDLTGAEAFNMGWDYNQAVWARMASDRRDADGLLATAEMQQVKAQLLAYDATSAALDRVKGFGYSADGLTPVVINGGAGILAGEAAFGYVLNDRTTNVDRLRQPDSYKLRSGVGLAQSLTSTGVKTSLTMAQDGRLLTATLDVTTQLNSAGATYVQLRITRGGNTWVIGMIDMPTASGVGRPFDVTGLTRNLDMAAGAGVQTSGSSSGYALLSGDVLDINVATAATVAGAANVTLCVAEQRAAF